MARIFNGKKFAEKKEVELREDVVFLRQKEVKPKLVSVLVGDDKASRLFVGIKKKIGERIGVEVEVRNLNPKVGKDEILGEIELYNQDKKTHGVMLQLPLPEKFSVEVRDMIINKIAKEKDVDGMREDSEFTAPVVKAVLYAIRESINIVRLTLKEPPRTVVVGSTGFEGMKIVNALKDMDYKVLEADINTKNLSSITTKADILISATGSPDLIGKKDIKEGAVVIDVGSPRGDVNFDEVREVASFITPVPGGIGPVTVVSLIENLVEACSEN